MITMLVYSIWH